MKTLDCRHYAAAVLLVVILSWLTLLEIVR